MAATVFEATRTPFALPVRLDHELETLRRYWSALRRADNPMPFADDLRVDHLSRFSASLVVLEVREKPERFRFDIVGTEIERRFGEELSDRFLDEIAHRAPLEFFASQCTALIETSEPTWHGNGVYERLLLPFWGNGYVSRIAGAYAWRTR